jgi:hypothetical protein
MALNKKIRLWAKILQKTNFCCETFGQLLLSRQKICPEDIHHVVIVLRIILPPTGRKSSISLLIPKKISTK